MKGVIDRFEQEQAVILIETENKEIMIPQNLLPQGAMVGTWLSLLKRDNSEWTVTVDKETTAVEATKTNHLLAKLRMKSKGSKFKK